MRYNGAMHSPERPPMTIIGFGRMGQAYAELFTPDFDVSVVSSRNLHTEVSDVGARQVDFEEAVVGADYVVPAVPLGALGEVVDKISPLVHPETVVFDTTSVKVKALRTLGGLSCRYFSTHLLSKTEMAICGGTDQLVEEALLRQGVDILHMTPEEHDEANAVMGMAQLIGLALGNELSQEDRTALGRSKSGATSPFFNIGL